MLALDIPFTALDSSRASFSARIADRAEYEESCEAKRERNADILREIYEWRFDQWFAEDTELQKLAIAAGYTAERIVNELDFMPAGTPWMDKLTEVKADILSVSLGIESIPRIARRMGLDAYKIGKEQADYLAWAKENGLPIFYANGGQEAVQSILTEPTNNNNDPAVNSGDSTNE
jgi:capsid protein